MKYNSIIFTLLLALFAVSCGTLELEDQLSNPNSVTPEIAELDLVMNNVILEFADFADEASDETMPYTRMVAMTGGDRYDNQDSPSSFDFIWGKVYSEMMPDINLVIELADAQGFTLPGGAAKIIKAYLLMTMVDMFGDIPYSEAFQGVSNPSPKADSGESVYAAALGLLDAALADLANPKGAISNDLFYNPAGILGIDAQAALWTNLANSLKLRYHVNTRLVGGSASEINAIVASGNLITDASGDWAYPYGSNRATPDSRHPYYSDGYESGGPGWYLSNYYMWNFFADKDAEDPRLRYYFYRQDCDETDENTFTLECQANPYPSHWPDGYPYCTATDPRFSGGGLGKLGYWGRDHGNDDGIPPDDLKRTAWGLYPAGGKFDADNCSQVSNLGTDGGRGAGIQPVLMSSYVYFLRAEAALTMGTSDDARMMLEMGVRESIATVMGFESVAPVDAALKPSDDDVNAYVDEVLARYDGANSDDARLNVIITEYWLSLQGQGLEAYNAYRRTCKPEALQPVRLADPGAFARSMWYPASYVNRNSNATQKPGVDVAVFWDTNPAGCAN